jgi:hypothetical protein
MSVSPWPFTNRIHVNTGDGSGWEESYHFPWTCHQRAEDSLCVIINLAAGMAHEITHVCNWSGKDGHAIERGNCRQSYVFENLVRWALYPRYPDVVSSLCCFQGVVRGLFGYGGNENGFNDDCVCADSSSTSPLDMGFDTSPQWKAQA